MNRRSANDADAARRLQQHVMIGRCQ
jgi:hypothetical protein